MNMIEITPLLYSNKPMSKFFLDTNGRLIELEQVGTITNHITISFTFI